MKKLFIALLTFLMVLCAFALTACSETELGGGHTHSKSEWIVVREASCKSEGLKHKKCTTCDAILEIDIVSDTYEHNYVYGECELCGGIDSTYMTEGLVYTLINDNTEYKVVGYTGKSLDVIIPEIYKGKPVTSIGREALASGEGILPLTNIVIPNTITSIEYIGHKDTLNYNIEGNLKYLGNSSNPYLYLADITSDDITSATINANCKLIGYAAFSSCDSLTSIVIPNSVTSIGFAAFSNCTSLTSIVIPNSVEAIGDYAFYYCTSLTSIVIPNSVTSIGDDAFFECTLLEAIEIPASVTSIGDCAFSSCYRLTIYCEIEENEKPSGWHEDWNYSNRPVVWGHKGEN